MSDELADLQLTPLEKNKLIAIYERFRRYHKQLSMDKMSYKIKEMEVRVKNHDKQIKHILKTLKRLLNIRR